jgi:hypothetical protein
MGHEKVEMSQHQKSTPLPYSLSGASPSKHMLEGCKTVLYATLQGATSAAMTHFRRTHELRVGTVGSEVGTAATSALEPWPRRKKALRVVP